MFQVCAIQLNISWSVSCRYGVRNASVVLKMRLPHASGTITLRNGYRARPVMTPTKSFEKGTSDPYSRKNNGANLGLLPSHDEIAWIGFSRRAGTSALP